MTVLRVADYLQIDRQRAPAVLLGLRNPQSPVSVQEWQKHRAVQSISPANDPRGKMVTISADLSLALYLQIQDLLAGLQEEMDVSTAVLDETYGTLAQLGLNQLGLATRRIYSNLDSLAFRDNLPYVPSRTGFSADPDLLTVLVEPLYGKNPDVGVRELTQNAVDAVAELTAWCERHNVAINSLDLATQNCDVLVEFLKRDNGAWMLRVRDRGIGMTAETIQNYFLRAGASFRRSSEWSKEFLDENRAPRVIRSGRFGIGAFATFLLGSSFRLTTRHVADDKATGYTLDASNHSNLIEIRRADNLPIGTTIEVAVGTEAAHTLKLEEIMKGEGEYRYHRYLQRNRLDWFCWDWPRVDIFIRGGMQSILLDQSYKCSIRRGELPPDWFVIHPIGYNAVYWTFKDAPGLSCNGLEIREPISKTYIENLYWNDEIGLRSPNVAVIDSAGNLPLTAQRYGLSEKTFPFIEDLSRDVLFSFIAHALICQQISQNRALSGHDEHPLVVERYSTYDLDTPQSIRPFSDGRLRWCSTATEMVPADPWLFSLLHSDFCLVYGGITQEDEFHENTFFDCDKLYDTLSPSLSTINWDAIFKSEGDDKYLTEYTLDYVARSLKKLSEKGVSALRHQIQASRLLIALTDEFESNAFLHHGFAAVEEYSDSISRTRRFIATSAKIDSRIPLSAVIDGMISGQRGASRASSQRFNPIPGCLFAAEFRIGPPSVRQPESLIAKVWYECLGAKAIPFDVAAREALIAEGAKHPQLKRHIDSWRKMRPGK